MLSTNRSLSTDYNLDMSLQIIIDFLYLSPPIMQRTAYTSIFLRNILLNIDASLMLIKKYMKGHRVPLQPLLLYYNHGEINIHKLRQNASYYFDI